MDSLIPRSLAKLFELSGKAGVHFYRQIKTATQQWNDFLNTDGASAASAPQDLLRLRPTMRTVDFPTNDTVYKGLNSRDFLEW